MRILVVSDTHHRLTNLERVAEKVPGVDLVFFLGDSEGQESAIRALFSCPVLIVKGNCDWFSQEEECLQLDLEGTHFLLMHGHRFGHDVMGGGLREWAVRNGAQVVCFGHTHVPMEREEDGILYVNPGSLSKPRQASGLPSYAVLNQDREGHFHAGIVEMDAEY